MIIISTLLRTISLYYLVRGQMFLTKREAEKQKKRIRKKLKEKKKKKNKRREIAKLLVDKRNDLYAR